MGVIFEKFLSSRLAQLERTKIKKSNILHLYSKFSSFEIFVLALGNNQARKTHPYTFFSLQFQHNEIQISLERVTGLISSSKTRSDIIFTT